jgi:acyl-CoA thioester hydrolase
MRTNEHEMEIRVRYCEADPMGFLHHANFFVYFEMGRTELFRSQGGDYKKMEERGFFLVVAKLECEFKSPAYYDDLLTLKTRIARMTPAKLEHEYELLRGTTLIAKARSILACLDRKGEVQRLTEELLYGEETP